MRYFDKPCDEVDDEAVNLAGAMSRRLRSAGLEISHMRTALFHVRSEVTGSLVYAFLRNETGFGNLKSWFEREQEKLIELSRVRAIATEVLSEWGYGAPNVFQSLDPRISGEAFIAISMALPIDAELPHEPVPKPEVFVPVVIPARQKPREGEQMRLFDVVDGIE